MRRDYQFNEWWALVIIMLLANVAIGGCSRRFADNEIRERLTAIESHLHLTTEREK